MSTTPCVSRPVDVDLAATVTGMASQYRRKRGTPTVALNLFVAPDVKEKIDRYAANANAPIWAIIEAAINAGQPDDTGVPNGWDVEGRDPATLPGLEEGGRARRSA